MSENNISQSIERLEQKVSLIEKSIDHIETLLRLKDQSPDRSFSPNSIDLGDRDIIKLKTLPRELAGHDLRIGNQTRFTWDEAIEKTKNLVDWRLPTAHEWVLIAEELALAEGGKLDGKQMLEKMGVKEDFGSWWSSTFNESPYAFGL